MIISIIIIIKTNNDSINNNNNPLYIINITILNSIDNVINSNSNKIELFYTIQYYNTMIKILIINTIHLTKLIINNI